MDFFSDIYSLGSPQQSDYNLFLSDALGNTLYQQFQLEGKGTAPIESALNFELDFLEDLPRSRQPPLKKPKLEYQHDDFPCVLPQIPQKEEKQSKKVGRACEQCQKSHLSCGPSRPCQRCINKGMADQCVDAVRRKRGRRKQFLEGVDEEDLNQILLQKQAQGQLTLQTQSQPRAVFPVPLKKAKVSSEDDLLTTPPEDFHKLIEYVSTRVPEAVDEFKKFETHVQPLITKIVKSYTKEAINSELSRFEQDIQNCISIFNGTSLPTVVWDKSVSIRYCNQSFRDLLSFDMQLPTAPDQFALYSLLSPRSVKALVNASTAAYADGTTSSVTFPCEVLAYGRYIDAIMCLTIKRYFVGIPLLHVGHLIPLVSSPVCDIKNAASVSKTLADVCGDKLLIDPTADFFNV